MFFLCSMKAMYQPAGKLYLSNEMPPNYAGIADIQNYDTDETETLILSCTSNDQTFDAIKK